MPEEQQQRPQDAGGRTVGDVLFYILTEKQRWLSFVALTAALLVLALLACVAFKYLFHVEPQEIQIFGSDPHVLLKSVEPGTGNESSLVLVHPQGWQQTEIKVSGDEELSFTSGGKINVDLHDINEKIDKRLSLEAKYKALQHLHDNDPTEHNVPEEYFSEDEIASVKLTRPWVGPEGFSLDEFQPTFRSRRDRYLLPKERAGGLVAAIYGGSSDDPPIAEAFYVGRARRCGAIHSGNVWLTVNDVQYDKYKNLFYNDNMGFFWVKITVKRREHSITRAIFGSGGDATPVGACASEHPSTSLTH